MESPKMHSSSWCKNNTTSAGRQTTPSHVSQYRAENRNLRKSGSTFHHGTVFELKQCLHQKKVTGMESPKMHSSTQFKSRTFLCGTANYPVSCKPVYGRERKFAEIRVYLSPWYRVCTMLQVWRVQNRIRLVSTKTALTCAGRQTTPSHVSHYTAEKGNLRKSGSIFRHGTVFAPKHCIYQKEAIGMESPKTHSSRQYKKRTYMCGTTNYPVSCKPVQGRGWKI